MICYCSRQALAYVMLNPRIQAPKNTKILLFLNIRLFIHVSTKAADRATYVYAKPKSLGLRFPLSLAPY
jgi:hypothetical protein